MKRITRRFICGKATHFILVYNELDFKGTSWKM